MTEPIYQTTELEVAAFLKASGYRLLGVDPAQRLVTFKFEPAAGDSADEYFAGAPLSARELFEAHRHLRTLIHQVKEHRNQKNGSDHNYGNLSYSR